MAMGCLNTAQALTDAEAVASIVGTPRLNTPFQIDFGFVNHGISNSALNVKVTNTAPAEFTLLSFAPLAGEGAACTNYGNEVVCTFPSTPPDAFGRASVTVQSPIAGVFSNRTTISRVLGDFNRTNDSLATAITVSAPVLRMRGFIVPETNATLPVAEIWLEGSNSVPVSVELVTADNGGYAGRSYVPLTNTVIFPPGVTTQQVTVTLIDNVFDEADPTFFVFLTTATNAAMDPYPTFAVVTILDNEPPSADLTLAVSEIDGGRLGGEFKIRIAAFNGGPQPISNLVVTNRLPTGSTLRFEWSLGGAGTCAEINGEWVCTIGPLPPIFGWDGFLIGTTRHLGSHTNFISVGSELRDHDSSNNYLAVAFAVAPPLATATAVLPEYLEGAAVATFNISLAVLSLDPVSFDYHTLDGTAVGGVDFTPTHGTLTFPPGVTNLTVPVPLLDNSLYEGSRQFSLMLSNAFGNHLAVPPATVTIVNDDPPPVVTLNDVTVVEGDENVTIRDLTFSLSTTSALPVIVYWGTADGTAVASQDYFSVSNYVYLFPGESSLTVQSLFIRGNTTFEPDENFRILLGTTIGATLARTQAVVTIIDDDAVPGRLDHFLFAPISSPRIANRPFQISVRAVDAFGAAVTNFTASAQSVLGGINLVQPPVLPNFVNGAWTGLVTVTGAATNAILRADDGNEHVGASNPFRSLANPPIHVTVPTNAVEGAGTLVGAGAVALDFAYDEDIIFTLSSANTNAARVPATVLLPAGQTNALFDIIVPDDALLDGTRGATIRASAQGFASGARVVFVHDNETAVLGLSLPTTVTEGSQNVQVMLTVSAPPDTNVAVMLSSTAPTRLQIPTSVSLSAGQISRVFTVIVVNDGILQGPQAIELRAHVENWTDGVSITTLIDNESTNMTLSWRGVEAPLLVEGQGTLSNALTLNFAGTLTSNLVVTLASSDPTELTVPAIVTNLAGASSVSVPITVMDDSEFDGLQTATITASAVGFGNGSRVATVSDDDVHHLAVSVQGPPTAGYPISGVPFSVFISSRDVNDLTITAPFNSTLAVALSGPNGPLGLTPTNLSSGQRGSWSQTVTALNWGSNFVLTATTTNGTTGQSNPFVIRPPVWSTNLSLLRAEIAGNDVRLHFASRPGYSYQIERSDTLPATAWIRVGSPATAAADVLVITDTGGATRPGRFYRLALLP